MDVKDYNQKLNRARDHFKEVQENMRSSYEKGTDEIRKNSDVRAKELSDNYDKQKSKLEEQNEINNDFYTNKSQDELAKRQENFRNEIKKNVDKFNQEKNDIKTNFREKLTNISDSYNRSLESNDRHHAQAQQAMSDRHKKITDGMKENFENQVNSIDQKNKDQFKSLKDQKAEERNQFARDNQKNQEIILNNVQDEKFKSIDKLKQDNENAKNILSKEKQALIEQQQSRLNDVIKTKNDEIEDGHKKLSDVQEDYRRKSTAADERKKASEFTEVQELKRKFDDDLRSVKKMADQKILGGTEVSNLKEKNKQVKNSFENRLATTQAEAKRNAERHSQNEKNMDSSYRQRMQDLELSKVEALDRKEKELNAYHLKNNSESTEKSNGLINHYKDLAEDIKNNTNASQDSFKKESSNRFKDQRIEFGKYINNLNEKKTEELSELKEDLTKDKTSFMEKTKRDFIDEKARLKSSYTQQLTAKDATYALKLENLENETKKIIDNYENRLNQLARKADQEVESLRASEEERKVKESNAFGLALEVQDQEHRNEVEGLRGKYENIISKDRAESEKRISSLIQKYEDQVEAERIRHNKELSTKVAEDQAQFQRLYKSSELEKATIRAQYEARIENLLNERQSNNTKKA